MEADRIIRTSVYRTIRDHFESGAALTDPYHVYSEQDLQNGVPVERPFLALLDFGTGFEMPDLPVVIIQLAIDEAVVALSEMAHLCQLNLHIFGANRGQRDDIASALKKLQAFTIRDFNLAAEPIVEAADVIEDVNGKLWLQSVHSISYTDLAIEGSLRNWTTVSAAFMVSNTASEE